MKNRKRLLDAGVILLDASYGLESVASALMSSHTKSRVVALEIMSLILKEPEGYQRNLDCFTYFRLKNGEPTRFKFLISMLMSRSTSSLAFQLCCMKFVNSLLAAAPTANSRVFLQEELSMAGLDPNLLISGVRQPEGKAKSSKRRHAPLPPPTPSSTPVPPTPPPLPPTPHTVLPHREETLTPTPNNPGGMKNVSYSPIPDNAKMAACLAELKSRNIIRRYANKENTISAEIHPFPTMNKSSAIVPIRNMPFLNWVPLANVEDTIFKSLNFERVLNEIELFDLEENFRIGKDNIQSKNDNFAAGLSPRGKDSKIRFMDSNRARNLSILQRRIGRSPEHIKQFIEEYDVDALLPDNAELLLKFVPTEEEMRTIMTLDFDFDDLGGAEQMLLQIVLALGNFINGNRKGHAVGFRVTSLPLLEEIRSSDKSKTLLAYVTEVVERHYFEVHDWYEDIDIQIPFKASYHAVLSTVKELREAMGILVREREDKLLFRKRWRQNITQKLNSRKRCSTPTRDQNFDNRTIDPRDLPSSPTFDHVHEERLTPSSVVTIPAHYSKDYDVKSFSYDPYGVMMPSGHTTPQLPIVENRAVCSPHMPPIIPTPTETCVENWVLNRPSVAPLQTPTDTCVENWIVSSPPPEKCSDVLKEECQVKILQLEEEPRDEESIFDCDSDSNDSAFVGSEGQHLKSSGSKSNELEEGYEKYGPDSKTSVPDRRLIAQLPEPVPDYPADDIPADVKPSGDMDEEITKILNEFEGDLNGYCSGATTPSPRRFVTIRSIIYM
ncbi:hypothetical protein FSP39_018105 [Pinctada imbricata]|uniref:FH2 domain-containing protein n=1 Tax=Pinctada imbricata TaxID=66713 RepID=A0AA89BRC5_PINIB|nr:hypothetical protein FSP39_018105 [Pinctada imbricata]